MSHQLGKDPGELGGPGFPPQSPGFEVPKLSIFSIVQFFPILLPPFAQHSFYISLFLIVQL